MNHNYNPGQFQNNCSPDEAGTAISHLNKMDYENIYLETLKEVMTLRRQLRAEQVKNTLAKLANKENKSFRLQGLENKLQEELSTHNRGERIDTLIEIIQDML